MDEYSKAPMQRKTTVPAKSNQTPTSESRGGVGRGAANRVSGGINRVAEFVVPSLVRAVDVEGVVERIDLERAVASIDVNGLAERVDLDALLGRVDVNALAERIDIDTLLRRVDLNALAERIDIDGLLSRVDVDALVNRMDIDAVLRRVDVHDLAVRADIGNLVAESSKDVASDVLDLVRRQCAGIDLLISRAGSRLTGGDPNALPTSPAKLKTQPPAADTSMVTPEAVRRTMTGNYAGGLSRLAAFAFDDALAVGLFTGFVAVLRYAVGLVSDNSLAGSSPVISGIGLAFWAFFYYFLGLAMFGRTVGMALLGLRVVERDGSHLRLKAAFIRVLAMPLSFLLLGLGLLGTIFGRERRALHDVIAGTVVVYDWGKRIAELSTPLSQWLAGREAAEKPR